MAYLVTSPGSCGEFIQGFIDGTSFMVTCPINRFSYALSGFTGEGDKLPEKSEQAVERTLDYLGENIKSVPIRLKSSILRGKGMASSTADISAVCQATALCVGKKLSEREIAKIALSIEPSDATFFKGIVQFDYRCGKIIREMGQCPDMQILVYDCGGEIDTMLFNSRDDLLSLQQSNEMEIKKAVQLFEKGLREKSLSDIGNAATISAFANQKILFKEGLDSFYKYGVKLGGEGVICAHSGTVLGLILNPSLNSDAVRRGMDKYCCEMTYIDTVRISNQGLRIRKCEINEFDAR